MEGGRCPELVFLAQQQTAGRGRQGRSWISDDELGIYATIVRPVEEGSHLQTLPLLVGVGLAKALRRFDFPVGLKWPNDLEIRGRKLGGILIETMSRGESDIGAIIGFGINHGHKRGGLPTPNSTSLRLEIEELPSLARIAAALFRSVQEELRHLGNVAYARDLYGEMSVHRTGEMLRCRLGERAIEGRFLGFDPRGFLRLEVAGREEVLSAGEILE